MWGVAFHCLGSFYFLGAQELSKVKPRVYLYLYLKVLSCANLEGVELYLCLDLSILDLPFPVLLSTLIRSRFQAKPATLLIPIHYSFPFRGGEALRYSVPKWLLILN